MNVQDISNREVATITSCESEPIHIPGAIQPHGVLLVVGEAGEIVSCSANCSRIFQKEPADIIGLQLETLSAELDLLFQHRDVRDFGPDRPERVALDGQKWLVFLHEADSYWLVELEEDAETPYTGADVFDQTRQFVKLIERSRSLQELCQRLADQTREITGYDRVMIYRFDKDNNGQVFAESRASFLEPFLGLYYPHTDIPPQARELYLRNMMRMIVDVNYAPMPLMAKQGLAHEDVDLSDSVLRSVSPMHIQYLKNMGVGSTLTISLLLEGKLWGLIACHHSTAKHLSYEQRKAALLQGHFLTSQIQVREVAEEFEVSANVEAHLQQLLNALTQEGDFQSRFDGFSSLLAVTNASGVAILHHGKLYTKGQTPASERVRQLARWLSEHTSGLQFVSSHLSGRYPEGDKISRQASGVLYHKLGDGVRDAIIWFREEFQRTINWAGDPQEMAKKALVNDLSPRSSFALFKETVKCHSREWRVSEINAATRFAISLQNQFHLEYLRNEEAQQRMLNEKLMKANKELSNINWITTHDLKEPLRKILLFASKVMKDEQKELSESITSSIAKIQGSAVRMQNLVDDIVSYSLTDDKSASFVETDLNAIVREVMEEYGEDFSERKVSFLAGELPTVQGIAYQLRQLFVNLIGNAIKFARKDVPLTIEIMSTPAIVSMSSHPLLNPELRYHRISVRDNGIGFEMEHATKIFDIFYRVHDRESYSGTGIGLAICKRIVENHSGMITATGEKGQGACFNIYLPV